jgi:predicted extracellular nuclease
VQFLGIVYSKNINKAQWVDVDLKYSLLLRILFTIFLLGWDFALPEESLPLVKICTLQGDGFVSPFVGQAVRTQGVVYADLDQTSWMGFFMQYPNCDGDSATSDGLFVYLGESVQLVEAGDLIEVSGIINEYYGLTEVVSTPSDVTILSQGNALPIELELDPPFDNQAALSYFEALEGMRVGLGSGRVVGPTNNFDRTWLTRADLDIWHVFHDDPTGTGELICLDDGGLYELSPEAKVGDLVNELVGALDYSYGAYRVQALNPPSLIQEGSSTEGSATQPLSNASFRAATFNLANLFDDQDDPLTEDSDLSLPEYQRRLHKRALAIHDALGEPTLLAVQEVENQVVLEDLLAQPEIQAEYGYLWQDGPDRRGIDLALLYRSDQVSILSSQVRQGCTTLIDGFGPDGNLDLGEPSNDITCDTDGDLILDGNRLFSRPPLVARVTVCPDGCPMAYQSENIAASETIELWLIATHFKSKVQDTDQVKYTADRRLQQAEFVAELVNEILASQANAHVLVLGDLNDYPDSAPLSALTGGSLVDLSGQIQKSERYTYIYEGISFVMDYGLLHASPGLFPTVVNAVHINADYPYNLWGDESTLLRSSDHDPLFVDLTLIGNYLYLPVIIK